MNEKIINLIKTLTHKNLSNQTVWEKTSGDSEFKIKLNKATLTVDNWADEDGNNYDLAIYNENGDKIESFHSMESDEFDRENYLLLKQLHESVVTSYFKIDETIDSILDELQSNKTIGKK